MVPLAAFLMTAFAASTAMAQAAPPAVCPIERAVFRLKSTPDAATLRFIKALRPNAWSLLSAELNSRTTGRVYRFGFTASNGYSTQYLEPTTPKPAKPDEAGYAVYFFTAGMDAIDLPSLGKPAPSYVFLPDLGKRLYYAATGASPDAKREYIPTEMWQFAECK